MISSARVFIPDAIKIELTSLYILGTIDLYGTTNVSEELFVIISVIDWILIIQVRIIKIFIFFLNNNF